MFGTFHGRIRTTNDRTGSRTGYTVVELLITIAAITVLLGLLLPVSRSGRGASRRIECANHLHEIALALREYESTYGSLPPAYTVDRNGNPLHSWRTLILPFLGEQSLYNRIYLTRAWNDPANAAVSQTIVHAYHCPEAPADIHTTYLAVVSATGPFPKAKSRRLSELRGELENLVMVFEADHDHAVPWMSPVDATEELLLGINDDSKLPHPGVMYVAFVDGRVLPVSATLPEADRRAWLAVDSMDTK